MDDPELAVRRINLKCANERKEVENERRSTLLVQMRGAASLGERSTYGQQKEWRKIAITIDSGAAETVVPHTMVTEYPIRATENAESGA